MKVGLDDDVLIGGFMITGSEPKRLILRAIGPSLSAAGVGGAMEDPMLELYDGSGSTRAEQRRLAGKPEAAEIIATGVAPSSSARICHLVVTLQPGSYTAVVRGWEQTARRRSRRSIRARLRRQPNWSISPRAAASASVEQALIGGLIVTGGSGKRVVIRALGPSLSGVGRASSPTRCSKLRDGCRQSRRREQ